METQEMVAHAYEESRYHRQFHHTLFGIYFALYLALLGYQLTEPDTVLKIAANAELKIPIALALYFALPAILTAIFANYQPGQARQLARDFAFAKSKEFERVTIDDPFVLKGDSNALCLRQLLDALDKLWAKFPAMIHIRTRHAPDTNQDQLEQNLRRFAESRGGKLKVDKIPAFGAGRRDLHDRRLIFTISGKTPKRVEVLLTGGIDRYLEPRFETSVVVRR